MGDVISFEVSETLLDMDCAESPVPKVTPSAVASAEVKAKAKQISEGGEYNASEVSIENPKNAANCTCSAKVVLKFQVPDKSKTGFRLCVSKDLSGVGQFAAVHSGDLIQFVVSETELDKEFGGNAASYPKLKTSD